MQHKGDLKHNIRLSVMIIKGTGPFGLIPLIIAYFLLPLLQYITYDKLHDMREVESRIMIDSQLYLPIASVINIITILYIFFDHDGKDGLRFYKKRLLIILIIPEIAYDIFLIPIFAFYYSILKDIAIALYFRCLIINLFYFASSILLTWLFKGITVAIVSCVIYTSLCIMEVVYGINISYYGLYYSNIGYVMDVMPYLIISIIIIIVYDRFLEKDLS